MRLRLRRLDPFEHDGRHDTNPTEMLHWIRNIPTDGAVTCGWDEIVPTAPQPPPPPT
jgi:hypothetical protein